MAINIHASCVVLGTAGADFAAPEDAGILLLGPSGAGKSDLALRLIAAGATLVADDRTVLTVKDEKLMAAAAQNLAGLIEVRNIGIVALPYRKETPISLVVELAPRQALARLPQLVNWRAPDGLAMAEAQSPPVVRLDPFENSAIAKIAVATAAYANALFWDKIRPM